MSSHIEYAAYLNIMYIPGSQELVVFMCAFIGAMIGFLWYNAYPAQVFMGDTGAYWVCMVLLSASMGFQSRILCFQQLVST